MKKPLIICLLFLPFLMACLSNPAEAQRGYRGSYGRYSRPYSSYSYRSYSPIVIGPRYYGIPHGSISLTFGGNPYYYYGGSYYQPYGGYYRPILPPIGIRIGALPFGYMSVYAGPNLYYFYNGIYYRQYDDRGYEVVDAPKGAQLASLPRGAKSVVVNGEKFYELNGTYYKEDRNYKGETVYTVVGKNGEIDNTDNEPSVADTRPRLGDKVSELPDGCKAIMLHGEKIYVAPDDTYYQRERDGTYSIVGLADTGSL